MTCPIHAPLLWIRVSILLAVLADRGRPLCPLFLSPTLPVSLNFSRRRLIVRLLGGFLPGKYLLNCREWRLPISLQNMPPQSLTSLAQYIELLDPLMPWDENLRLYLWFTWKWERYVSYCGTGKNLIKVTFFWPTLYNRKAKNTTLSEQFQTTIENYRKRQINVRENRRTIKNGQPRDTVNIDHTKTNKTQHIYRKLKRYRPHQKQGVNQGAHKRYAVPASFKTPAVLLVYSKVR